MEMGNNDGTKNPIQYRNVIFYIDPPGAQTWDVRNDDTVKNGEQDYKI